MGQHHQDRRGCDREAVGSRAHRATIANALQRSVRPAVYGPLVIGPNHTQVSQQDVELHDEANQVRRDASEITMLAIDSQQQAQNTTMGGLPPGTLTLQLPVQKPPVAVPVIELFLKD